MRAPAVECPDAVNGPVAPLVWLQGKRARSLVCSEPLESVHLDRDSQLGLLERSGTWDQSEVLKTLEMNPS